MEICEFLKAVNEINKANEMAFRYAASILEDFKNLTPAGRSLMADFDEFNFGEKGRAGH